MGPGEPGGAHLIEKSVEKKDPPRQWDGREHEPIGSAAADQATGADTDAHIQLHTSTPTGYLGAHSMAGPLNET